MSAMNELRYKSSLPHFQPKDSNPIPCKTVAEYTKSLGDSISSVVDRLNSTDPLLYGGQQWTALCLVRAE